MIPPFLCPNLTRKCSCKRNGLGGQHRKISSAEQAGVDRISVGALTHSAPALDIGLDYDGAPGP